MTNHSVIFAYQKIKQIFDINFTILMFGSLYGLRANNFNTIHKFIKQGIKNKKIERVGNGAEIRNYINVKDAAKICVEILKKKYANQYYNIMGKEKMTVGFGLGMFGYSMVCLIIGLTIVYIVLKNLKWLMILKIY